MTTTEATIRDQVIDIATAAYQAHASLGDPRLQPGALLTPLARRFLAASERTVCIWLGHMEAYNGGITIEEIVRLAFLAECKASNLVIVPSLAGITALVQEGLWRGRGETNGPSWFDDHASFVVPSRVHPNGITGTRD